MNKEPIILIGGGGHCRSVIDVIESQGQYEIFGIVDMPDKVGTKVLGYPIIGSDSEKELKEFKAQCPNFLVTVGQVKSAQLRKKIFHRIKVAGGQLPIIISPKAHVSKHAKVEEGTVIHHFAMINANAKVGVNCIINSRALIEHDAVVGDHCHISTHGVINGAARVGEGAMVGSNACMLPMASLPENSMLAASSILTQAVVEPGIYLGHPAKLYINE
jgi:sugar O-acyltransferase (sialic acid O-acetyltransferase NeuD family)